MGEINKQAEGVTGPAGTGSGKPMASKNKGGDVSIVETKEREIKARIPVEPNMTADGLTEFPAVAILVYANGTRIVLPIRQPKPSSASGKINAWGGGKIALEDNTQVQVGINLTVLD
jgi:hypothetical protein